MNDLTETDIFKLRQKGIDALIPWINKLPTEDAISLFVWNCVDNFPDAFYIKPASSTGKYHPAFAQDLGGLLRHTIAVLTVWDDLYRAYEVEHIDKQIDPWLYTEGIIACIFHDCCKYGDTGELEHTTCTHDELSAHYFWYQVQKMYEDKLIHDLEFNTVMTNIANAIRNHHGPWSTMRKPQSLLDNMVFTADYIASRKYITLEGID